MGPGPSKVREALSNAVAEGQLQAAWQSATMLKPAEAPGASMMPIPQFANSRSTLAEFANTRSTFADSGGGSCASTPISGSGALPVAKSATLRPDEAVEVETQRSVSIPKPVDVLMNEDERLRMSRRLSDLKEEARQFAVQDGALEPTGPVPPINALSTSCIRNLHQYFIFPQGMDERQIHRSIDERCRYNSAGPLPSNIIGM